MNVYVITMEAVYDHGCGGVFTTRGAAETYARALADDSDGYHDFRVEEYPIDHPVWVSGRFPSWRRGRGQRRRPTVSFHPYDQSDEQPVGQ